MSEKNIDYIIEEAWQEAERENDKKAIEILEQAIKDFPKDKDLILLQLAQIYFRERQDLKALETFKVCYNNLKNEEILEFLLSCYNEPNIKEYKKRYYENIEIIKNYKYFYGDLLDFEDIQEKILWEDEKQSIYYSSGKICSLEHLETGQNLGKEVCIFINQCNMNKILEYEEMTRNELNYLTAEVPMYLYYDEDVFGIIMQLIDFKAIVKKSRIVIIVGKKQLQDFFDDIQAMLPRYLIGNNIDACWEIMQSSSKKMQLYFDECKSNVKKYYKENSLKVLENIKNGNPKILFRTTRFSTVLQYHIKNCINAAQEIGLKTRLVIEKSDIHRITELCDFDAIYKLKPDIIFCLNHFRFEENLPEEIVWVTWVQDPMEYIMNKNTPSKLSDRDFVLNHLYTWKEFEKLNYPKERLFDAPIPSNPNVYKPYVLSKEEKEKYSCDICFVCHAADFEEQLNIFLRRVGDATIKKYLEKMAYEYYDIAYTEGILYYSRDEFKVFFLKLMKKWEYSIEEYILDIFAEQMHMWLNQRIFRQILVNWLIDAGYGNIKLWGNGWIEHEKYKKYAMGPAQNGEQLSKIYQCSKINIGNNIGTTAAARAWESMLSGGFYMSNYIPEEHDISDIRKILKEDEFVMFYDKNDFLSKVKYYLENKDKRLNMIEIGRECALERMTFEAVMKKTIKNIAEYYEKGI